ncbi:haloacid dehalogenase-like hydrolase [Pelagibius litoralis]|uniref:phosphoserine phosphatase n=1 Tax=Pelagibius litoralis TaxID=374515 RepID=A0A967EXM2_9PROT|nr:HAD family hydrolase [Pelagibius litoralis]NIA69280.1 haloacid dehalogenase-like hydrolase [Pelagibius litoralis]
MMYLRSLLLAVAVSQLSGVAVADPLPSWNTGLTKSAILSFVERVTDADGGNYVPPSERIAVFDNDGTLWSEQPMYFQLIYALDRVRALAPQHPEWVDNPVLKAAMDGDVEGVLSNGKAGLMEVVMVSHAGMTVEDFKAAVRDWLAKARHPRSGRAYDEMVYQPMLELLSYLRAEGFKTFIVSGGGVDFIRVFAEEVYGIPPERVVGSSIKAAFEQASGAASLRKMPALDFIDDKAGKPIAINLHIGRRPLAAFGNSDGDLQMLQYTTTGTGLRFGLIVRHSDAEREWIYDRDSHIGRLDKALDQAEAAGWTVVDMKRDWRVVYPFELE